MLSGLKQKMMMASLGTELIDQSGIVAVFCDAGDKILHVSLALEKLINIPTEVLEGSHISRIFKTLPGNKVRIIKKSGVSFIAEIMRVKHGKYSAVILQNVADAQETDLSSGTLSREAFVREAERESVRASRYQRPLSMVMIGLDSGAGPVQTMDTHLRAFGETMISALRANDIIGRWDADSFVILTPETTKEQAYAMANRLHTRILTTGDLAMVRMVATVTDFKRGEVSINTPATRLENALKTARTGSEDRAIIEAD